jgi:predicted RNase H-like nuclease (RuvC/YqgF family)
MKMPRVLVLLSTSALLFAITAYAQDSQSLGDAARQARQQKQQKDTQAKISPPTDPSSKEAAAIDAPAKNAQPAKSHVITNEEIGVPLALPEAAPDNPPTDGKPKSKSATASDPASSSGDRNEQAEEYKSRIQDEKGAIEALQSQIAELSESIRFAGANCVANCEQWNEHQKRKLDQVESMKSQLEEQKKQLQEMQDSARKQGFGSSVYEP